MTQGSPITVSGRDWEPGLWWMVLASLGLHLSAVIAVLLMPRSFLHPSPTLHSYTVDLIAPERLGGTNMIQGGKGRVDMPPVAAAPPAPKVEPPKPPPPKVEEPKPEPKPELPKAAEPPVEVAKPEPKPPPPKPEEKPKIEEPPKQNEMALTEKKAVVPPTAAKMEPTPRAKAPPPSPKAVAKAEPVKPQPPPQKAAKSEPKPADAKAAKEAAAAQARDDRIAAAIKRVEQQSGERGGGSGSKSDAQPGGPISVGPGEGAGGSVKGVQYLLYYNQMINRIRQSWAWAGRNEALEALVRFNVTETGEVFNVRITRPSGDASYDASVERAVRAASPLAPPPEAYRKEFGDVELTFRPPELQQ